MRYRTVIVLLAIAIPVLSLWAMQIARSGWCNDEAAHIPSGLYHLATGRMDAYHVNPPLPRMIAALPLLVDRPMIKWHHSDSPYVRLEYQLADEWVNENQSSLRRQLILARSTTIFFFGLGIWSIVRWTYRIYGYSSAILAGVLWSFNPDVLTYASVVGPDLPASSAGLLVGYRYWNWLTKDDRPFPWDVAIAVGLAILCKFSWLFLLPVLPLVTVMSDIQQHRHQRVRDAFRLGVSFSVTLVMINWCYGFEGTGKQLGDFRFISASLAGQHFDSPACSNRFAGTGLGHIPVPLPREMVRGIDYLKWEFERGYPSYVNGEWSSRGRWWFYLYAIGIKMPLGYWIIILAGLLGAVMSPFRQPPLYSMEWVALFLGTLYFVLISSQTGFTHHVRYVLPCYGFLFILASRLAAQWTVIKTVSFASVCLAGTLWFHATLGGLSHTFFNPVAGGPKNGWRHLSFSNVDWGQSTYRMANWVRDHPQFRPLCVEFAFIPGIPELLISDQEDVVVDPQFLDASSTDGYWRLISSERMTQLENRELWNLEPEDQPFPDFRLYWINVNQPAGSTHGTE